MTTKNIYTYYNNNTKLLIKWLFNDVASVFKMVAT